MVVAHMWLDMNLKQRTNLKFFVRLSKTPSECLELLQQVYGKNAMSHMCVCLNGTNDSWKDIKRWKTIRDPEENKQNGGQH